MHFRNETLEAQHVLGEVVEPGDTVEATGDAAKSLEASPNWKRADRPKRQSKAETPDQSDPSDEPTAVEAATNEETD